MPRSHLTENERYVICHMSLAGFKPAVIARKLGRHRATIGRELKRNQTPYERRYFYDTAQRLAEQRCRETHQRYKLDHSPLGQIVRKELAQRWSPEQIVGRLQRKYPHHRTMRVTHETIYRWVYRRHTFGERWYKQLRRRRPRRRRRIPGDRGSAWTFRRLGIRHDRRR